MIRWADTALVREAVETYARALRREHPAVSRVIWYGSWVDGIPTPRSDADLCIVVAEDSRRPRERVPDFLPARFPVPVDVSVLTEEEWRALPSHAPAWFRAISRGRVL